MVFPGDLGAQLNQAPSIESIYEDSCDWLPLAPIRGNPSLWTPARESALADEVVHSAPTNPALSRCPVSSSSRLPPV